MIKLDHAGIKARDLEKSVKFYTEALGLEVIERNKLMGLEFVFVGNSETKIEIEQAGKDNAAQDVTRTAGLGHLALIVDNLDATIERLRAYGAKIVVPPIKLREDRRFAYIEDPDGARVQLIELLK